MNKYQLDVEKLLEYVGGRENIVAVSHCATRMRFILNDASKTDEKKIEDIPSVKGMFTNAGQFQVIIGNDVSTFYNEFSSFSGIEGISEEQGKSLATQNQTTIQRIIAVLAEIFQPILPAIIVGGLILGFRNVLEGIEFSALGGQRIIDVSVFWNGVNDFLWLPGEAIFHFLPVGITWSVTKKMGTTQILGIILGITLVSPQLLNAYAVAETAAIDMPFWDFGFTQINKVGYQAQVIPAMLAGFMLAYLEKYFRKRIPEAISMIFVPLFSLLPTILAAHVILGPVGWKVGDIISNVVNTGLTSAFSWLFSFAFGALFAPLVITGMHHMTNAIDMQLISSFGTTNLWPMIAISNIAQGSAVLAVIFLHKGNKKEEQISIPATISAYLGITEPAMFGINLKYVYPFVAAMIGSGLSSMINNLMGIRANSIGVGGLPGILAINAKEGAGWTGFGLSMLIAIAVPFFLTIIFQKKGIFNKIDPADETTGLLFDEENSSKAFKQQEELFVPVSGELALIDEVNDSVFSKKMMGDGFVVLPTDNKIYSPIDGKIITIFETKHAIGIMTEQGTELLIHMGLDTVALKGEPFCVKVKEGQRVERGSLLAEMDLDAIRKAGKKTDIVTVIMNMERVSSLSIDLLGNVNANDVVGSIEVK